MSKTVMNKVRNTANKNLRRKIKQRKSKFVKEVVLTAPGPSQKAVRKMQREQRRLVKELSAVGITKEDLETGVAAQKVAALETKAVVAAPKVAKKSLATRKNPTTAPKKKVSDVVKSIKMSD